MPVKYMYKIHALNVSNGISRSLGNDTFYETYEEALEQARHYVTRHGTNRTAMVIYKAQVLVRREPPMEPPVEVLDITGQGELAQYWR